MSGSETNLLESFPERLSAASPSIVHANTATGGRACGEPLPILAPCVKAVGFQARLAAAAVAALLAAETRAGEFFEIEESWQAGGMRGWKTASGAMTVQWTDEVRDRGGLRAVFSAQGVAFPEVDSFLADSAASDGMFSGDLASGPGTARQLAFDFQAERVLPSALWLQWVGVDGNATNSFTLSLTNQVPSTGGWHRVVIPLRYEGIGWMGGGSAQNFSNALHNVRALDVRLVRRGTEEQSYCLDNFALTREIPSATATNDTDRDGLPDYWELRHFGGVTNGLPEADSDGDGQRNLAEFTAGTDPTTAGSALRVSELAVIGASTELGFNSTLGRIYGALGAGAIVTQDWSVQPFAATGSGGYLTLTVTNGGVRQFYRLQVTRPPPSRRADNRRFLQNAHLQGHADHHVSVLNGAAGSPSAL